MADIPGSIASMNDVEIASDAPVTEALFSKIGANINEIIAAIQPVGTIVASVLTEAEFQAEKGGGTEWIIADGRSITGSRLQILTGVSNAPELRGRVLKGKNNGISTSLGDEAGERALGNYQADALLQHQHTDAGHSHDQIFHSGNINHNVVSGVAGLNTVGRPPGAGPDFGFFSAVVQASGANITNVSGAAAAAENRVRNVCVNWFVRIN